jgi:hypothetical protein
VQGDRSAWVQQAADAAELTEGAPRQRRLVWPLAALVVSLLAVAATAYWVVIRDQGPPHPDAWDARVQDYVDVVEDERDLEFEHPVYVDFLSEDEFSAQVTSDEDDLSDEDREEIDQATGMYRALGLLEGDVDLFEQFNELRGGGTLGYYSYEDERIRIRGEELTPAVQSTLVHELTHALQDQHFDLEAMKERAEDDDAASSAVTALIEGDARRIESEWREGLDEDEVEALDEDAASQSSDASAALEDVPEILRTLISTPYAFGEAMLAVAVEEGGDDAVDDLFERPPTTEEHQLDPWTLIEDHAVAIQVQKPEVGGGEEEFGDGSFGAIGWLLVLAERIPVEQALTAADGWGGDSYVAFEKGDRSCVRIDYRGDSAADLTQMQSALRAWIAKAPKTPASSRLDGSRLVFESCDPGARARRVATESSEEAVQLALLRTYLSTTLTGSGLAVDVARCSADRLVRSLTVKQLNSSEVDPALVRRVVGPCLAQARDVP